MRTRSTHGATVTKDAQDRPLTKVQIIPRFARSASQRGAALAERILREFRKDPAAIDLTPMKHRRTAKTRGK